MAMIRLTVTHAGQSQAVELSEPAIALGRTHENTLQIHDEKASRQHCRIEQTDDGSYRLRDLDSRNGTYVNGGQVTETALADGDRIRIGKTTILVEILAPAGAETSPPTEQASPDTAPESIELVFLDGPRAGKTVSVADRVVTLGRQPKNDVVVDDPRASNRHAQIRRGAEGLVLVDRGSRNGTFVNDERITTRPIQPGDTIRIGNCRLRVTRPGEAVDAAASAPAAPVAEQVEERTATVAPQDEAEAPAAPPAEAAPRRAVPVAALVAVGALVLLLALGWLLLTLLSPGSPDGRRRTTADLLGERGNLRAAAAADAWQVDEALGRFTSQGLALKLPAKSDPNALGAHVLAKPLSVSPGKTYAVAGELAAGQLPDGQAGILAAWLGDADWAPRAETFLPASPTPGADDTFRAHGSLTAPPWADRLALACAARGRSGTLTFRSLTAAEEPSQSLPHLQAAPLRLTADTPMTFSLLLDSGLATAGAGLLVRPRASRAVLPAAHGEVAAGFPKTEDGAYTCRAALPLQLEQRSTRLWVEQTLASASHGLQLTCRVWTEDDAAVDFVGLALAGPAPSGNGGPEVRLSTGFVPWTEARNGSLSDVLGFTRPVGRARLTVASDTPLELSIETEGQRAVYRLGRQGIELRSTPLVLELGFHGTDAAEERRLAGALKAAEQAAQNGRLGDAIRRFAAIAKDYPHRREGAEQARGRLEALRRQADQALAGARRALRRAELSQEDEDFAAARQQLEALRTTLEGTSLAKTANGLLDRCRDAQSTARQQGQERICTALLAAARRHQEQNHRHIARLHCQEILDRFPDSPATAKAQALLDTLNRPPAKAPPDANQPPPQPAPQPPVPTPTEPRTP
jgi:pSer/pThr/pTyr-binding forkhead associated (FHA) protein